MDKYSRTILIVMAIGFCLAFLAGCQNDAQTGALIGTGVGAGVGSLAGRSTEGTLIGAAVGGALGYGIGNEQDKQKAAADRDRIRQEMNVVMVNVTNSNGSIIQVAMRRNGVGYVGPRGEYYPNLPSSDQLRPVYGF
jgi:hypothetical protein